RAPQVAACVLEPASAFQLQRGDIEQQRMLQPGTQCGERGGSRPGEIARGSHPMHLADGFAVSGRVARCAVHSSGRLRRSTKASLARMRLGAIGPRARCSPGDMTFLLTHVKIML